MEIIVSNAGKFLKNVPDSHVFWLASGEQIKNIEELASTLEKINDDIFYSHVNDSKNDFCNWIRDCIGDITLVEALIPIKSKKEVAQKIKDRVKELRTLKSKPLATTTKKDSKATVSAKSSSAKATPAKKKK